LPLRCSLQPIVCNTDYFWYFCSPLADFKMFKRTLRNLFIFFGLDLTKNLRYDRLTGKLASKLLKKNSRCIDVGSHKGEFLDLVMKLAPDTKHYAFEPIPAYYNYLKENYTESVHVLPYAVGEKTGETKFHYVLNAPAYSGILKRKYSVDNPEISEITVPMTTLDEVIPENEKIDLIKIDVEGGEFSVLKGAEKLIKRDKPYIIFECGLGASDYYGTTPQDIFDFLSRNTGLKISLMDETSGEKALSREEFCKIFNDSKEYYFLAHP
jgi:FkbM family methyltransferase